MDRVIHIGIREKVARQTDKTVYVCGNSDYTVEFDFDAEWDAFEAKTARFVHGGSYTDVVFTGSVCPVPVIENTWEVKVGVFAGNLHTTTPAIISGKKSILCESGTPAPPADDVYHQIMTKMDDTVKKSGESAAEAAESAERSDASAGDAAASAESAYDSASNAAASEEAAEGSAQNALTYAQNAESSAVHAAESAVSAQNSSATSKAYEEEAARCAQNAQEAAAASADSAERAKEIADGLYTDVVRYGEAQALTDEEQAAARENIGAAAAVELDRVKGDLGTKLPKSPADWEAWTAEDQATARERMGVGDYELIEEIELVEEVSRVSRSEWPDGTPYRLKKVLLSMYNPNGFPAGGVSRVDFYNIQSSTLMSTYLSYAKYVTYEIEAFVESYKVLTMGSDYDYGAVMKSAAYSMLKSPSIGLQSIAKIILITGSVTMPVGTKIRIYGVRA